MTERERFTDVDIVAYLAGDLDVESAAEIAVWINASESAQQRVAEFRRLEQDLSASLSHEPPPGLLESFRQRLEIESGRKADEHNWYRIAAAVVLVIAGFAAGRLTTDQNPVSADLTALQADVRSLQQLVMLNTLQDHSASERLQAIHAIDESPAIPDPALLQGLIGTMNNDDSPNVRYAAILALARYMDDETVRMQFVRALKTQEDPFAQIALIRILTNTGEKAAIAPLRKFINHADTPPDVRRAAEIALDTLI